MSLEMYGMSSHLHKHEAKHISPPCATPVTGLPSATMDNAGNGYIPGSGLTALPRYGTRACARIINTIIYIYKYFHSRYLLGTYRSTTYS